MNDVQQCDMSRMYSPRKVAAALGVSESSLKRWADAGKLHVDRTVGGHRRISADEAARFARVEGLRIVQPEVLGLPGVTRSLGASLGVEHLGQRLLTLASSGHAQGATALLAEQYHAGMTLGEIFDGPVLWTMREVGTFWKRGRRGIEEEHAALQSCVQCVISLRLLVAQHQAHHTHSWLERPVAVGGAPEGDPYQLGTLMAAAILEEAGFAAVNLGPETPLDVLGEAIARRPVKVVWLSCSAQDAVPHPSALEALVTQVESQDATLIMGGTCRDAVGPRDHPRVKVVDSMQSLSTLAREIIG